MGDIQNSVNNMISTAGVMAGLAANSPAGKLRQQKQELDRQDKSVDKQMDYFMSGGEALTPEQQAAEMARLTKAKSDIATRRYELDPSDKRLAEKGMAQTTADIFSPEFKKQYEAEMEAIQREHDEGIKKSQDEFAGLNMSEGGIENVGTPITSSQVATQRAEDHLNNAIEMKRNNKPNLQRISERRRVARGGNRRDQQRFMLDRVRGDLKYPSDGGNN